MTDFKSTKINSNTEIFRHLRPQWYNSTLNKIVPDKMGGISFMFKPVDNGVYDFWVNFCPKSSVFSDKQAVQSLRNAYSRGAVPFGTIKRKDKVPLLDQVVEYLVSAQLKLPSEISEYAMEISLINALAEKNKNAKG